MTYTDYAVLRLTSLPITFIHAVIGNAKLLTSSTISSDSDLKKEIHGENYRPSALRRRRGAAEFGRRIGNPGSRRSASPSMGVRQAF